MHLCLHVPLSASVEDKGYSTWGLRQHGQGGWLLKVAVQYRVRLTLLLSVGEERRGWDSS